MSLKKKNFFFYLFSIPPHSLFTNHVISFLLFTAFRIMQATTNYTKIKSERFNMARKATPLSFSPWSLSKRRRPVRSPSAVLSRVPGAGACRSLCLPRSHALLPRQGSASLRAGRCSNGPSSHRPLLSATPRSGAFCPLRLLPCFTCAGSFTAT